MTLPAGINPSDSPGLPIENLPGLPSLPNSNPANSSALPDNNTTAPTNGYTTDQLAVLLQVTFDGNAFPTTFFNENGSHDLAIHKYPNLDAARLENTGRNSSVFSVKAIFTNNIYPSVNETWLPGTLFPMVFNNVLTSLYDTGNPIKTITHPYLGTISVMVQNWSYEFNGNGPRDGAFINMTFMETQTQTNILKAIAPANPISSLTQSAAALDTLMKGAPVPIQPSGMSLSGFFSQIAATVRGAMAIPTQVVNSINTPISQINIGLNQIASSSQFYNAASSQYVSSGADYNTILGVNFGIPSPPSFNWQSLQNVYAASFALNQNTHNNANQFLLSSMNFINAMIAYYTSMSNVETAQLKLNLYLMLGQLQQIQNTQFGSNNNWKVQQYITKVPTTLISLANILNNSVDQLLSLNPTLNKVLFIQSFTPVSYYQAK